MKRKLGQFTETVSYDETVRGVLPAPLPPAMPDLDPASYQELN
ncbi:hypothetical protein [Pantoea sp. DY-15]|nr:hypothetical protein [Pantoea sp. DY-15]